MSTRSQTRSMSRWLAAGIGAAVGAYATYVGVTWSRYGHRAPARPDEEDSLLDRFMPTYEVVERHHVRVAAPAAVTLAAACEQDLFESPVVRAIFKTREVVLGAAPDSRSRPHGLLPLMESLGWGVLAEDPGREIVVGAVTRPWEANVTFRAVPPDQFAAFDEADYVKIVWTLRADPLGEAESIFRTETRVMTTDAASRATFRWYWAFFSPGIRVIRWLLLAPVKTDAERQVRAADAGPPPAGAGVHPPPGFA